MLRKIANALAALLIAQALVAPASVAPAHAQFAPGGGGTNIQAAGNAIDPTILFGADITGAATTGTITNGTNSLAVANAATWSVGQGIAIHNAGTGGNTELIGCVGSITGTTFTIVTCGTNTAHNAAATATTQAVNHDDTYALTQAVTLAGTSGRPIQLQPGAFFVTSAITFTDTSGFGITMRGAGMNNTFIENRGTANDTLVASVNVTFSDFYVLQSTGSPSAGYGINITGGVCPGTQISVIMDRININGTYGGLHLDEGVTLSRFTNINIFSTVGGQGVYYHVTTPCGDNFFVNDIIAGASGTTDFVLFSADTMSIDGMKLNGGSKFIVVHEAIRVRVINPSFEATGILGVPCGIDFGTSSGGTQMTITGGEIAGYQSAFCNTYNNVGGSVSNTQSYANGGSGGGSGVTGNGILNIKWPVPVVTGCTTNGTANGDALKGNVVMTCTAQAMVMTFNAPSNAVPTNGQICQLFHANGTLIPQTGTAVNNGGSNNSTATFAGLTTSAAETLAYQCQDF